MIPLPDTSANRIKLTRSGYIKMISLTILVFIMIIVYVFQFDHFDKILDIRKWLILSGLTGIGVGYLIGKKNADKEGEAYEQMRIYMICIVLSVVFMPLVMSLINRYGDFKAPQFEQVELLGLKPQVDQPFGHLKGEQPKITHYESAVLLGNKIYNFSTKVNPFSQNAPGDVIQLPVQSGLLGIRYIDL